MRGVALYFEPLSCHALQGISKQLQSSRQGFTDDAPSQGSHKISELLTQYLLGAFGDIGSKEWQERVGLFGRLVRGER